MAEYNPWDGRTTECNDSNWCPIANDYCLDQDQCGTCEIHKEFENYLKKEGCK